MITADKLALLTNMPTVMLQTAIRNAGYSQDKFKSSKFLGLTNSGEFCYSAEYQDLEDEICTSKVFVRYDPGTGKLSADY